MICHYNTLVYCVLYLLNAIEVADILFLTLPQLNRVLEKYTNPYGKITVSYINNYLSTMSNQVKLPELRWA